MKKIISISIVFLSFILQLNATPVVDYIYDDKDYHRYYCDYFDFPNKEHPLNGAVCYVEAYNPEYSLMYYIQFATKFDAITFCRKYKNITSSLSHQMNPLYLDNVTRNLNEMMKEYAPRYCIDWEYMYSGTIYRYVYPTYKYVEPIDDNLSDALNDYD